jgi:hypothetical protein
MRIGVNAAKTADAAEHPVLHGKMHLQIFDFEQCVHGKRWRSFSRAGAVEAIPDWNINIIAKRLAKN